MRIIVYINIPVRTSFKDEIRKMQVYKMIVDDICSQISNHELSFGDRIRSLNESCSHYNVSRESVVKAYNELKSKGIISTIPGKGNFVKSTNVNITRKALLIFDELTLYKSTLYNTILKEIEDKIPIEIFFHHFNLDLLFQILSENEKSYTDFIVMPIYDKLVEQKLIELKKNANVFLLDQGKDYFKTDFPKVCQDFHYDLYNTLVKIKEGISKYDNIYMQIDKPNNSSEEFIVGKMKSSLRKFCR
jgi:DNA-binding transcriptional regulator YhcF (GntR family)